jgi:hypothetical protein
LREPRSSMSTQSEIPKTAGFRMVGPIAGV